MKKPSNKQAKKASKLAKAENLKNKANKIITVKNAEGDPDTTAEIVIQNKIDYEPKVSVIIPVYNVEQYLRECLDSVVNQTLKEIEIICVDDGSTDSSLEILKEYAKKDNRITVMKQENRGSGPARNNGIKTAKGEFIAFMDSDDLYPNKKTLQTMYDKAIKHNVLICGGSLSQIKDDKLITDSSQFEDGYSFKKERIVEYKDYQFDYGYWRFIFNRIFLVENTLYFPDYLRQQDPPFFVKTMSLAERFYALNEPTYVYRVSHKQISWNERKVVDLFKGIRDCLIYSKQYNLNNMHSRIAKRLNLWTFRTAAATMVDNKNVRQQILQTLNTIDYDILKKEKLLLELDDIYKAIIQAQDNDVLVSIIIPCYNVAKYLPRCLNSVINQTFKSIEIICINDGSTDETLEVLKKYAQKDKRIKIINKKNGGLSSARNAGICEARGSFISFIDSDDWIDITTIEKATTKMSGNVDLVCYGAELVNEGLDENNLNTVIGSQYHKIKIIGDKIASSDNILKSTYTVWNKLFKKSILNKFGIKFAEGLLFEDNDYSIMYMVHCRNITYLDEYLYHYVQRPNSIMERLRAGSCDKTSDNLYIFDNLYKHLEKFDLLEKYQKVIASRFSIHLRAAYKYAPDNLKKKICILAKEITKKYRRDLFWGCVIENIQCSNFKKVRELTDIIVSLTSYPARIQTVNQTIESILNQSMKADKVILWLAPEQFPNKEKDLPKQLLDLCNKGLTIDWYHDIKSYKKLIPTLKKYPNDIIITADDDIIYPKNWISDLYKEYSNEPNTIWCHRAHSIKLHRNVLPYKQWSFCVTKNIPKYSNFCTTGGGILYPPNCFYKDVTDENKFLKYAPNADDIWFWAMLVLNNKKINVISNNMKKLDLIDGTQETALWKDNVINNQNDTQFINILNVYPQLIKILKKEYNIDSLKKNLKQYLLFPYYLIMIIILRIKLRKRVLKHIKRQLQNARIDIKNNGTKENSVIITSENAKINKPAWFKNKQGEGAIIETNATSSTIKIKAVNDGNLTFDFRASDKRYNGERFAVWVDYKSVKINGKEILTLPIETWHDKPFRYSMPIKDGQEIFVEILQQHHKYTNDKLKDIVLKLNSDSKYIKDNINKLIDILCKTDTNCISQNTKQPSQVFSICDYGEKVVYRILGFKLSLKKQKRKFLYDKVKTDTYTKTYICGICVKKKPANVFNFIDSRVCNLSNQLSREINKQTQLIENKLKLIETKQVDLTNNIKKEMDNIATLQNNLEAKVKADVLSVKEANLYELNKINEEISTNKEKLVALEDLISNTNQQINEAIVSSINANSDNILRLQSVVKSGGEDITSEISALYKEQSSQLQSLKEQVQSNRESIVAKLDDNETWMQEFKEDILQKYQEQDYSTLLQSSVDQLQLLKEQAQSNRENIVAKLDSNNTNVLEFKKDILNKYQELNYADLLHDSIINCEWLKNKSFSLYGWAANYSFIYTLFRILDKAMPHSILEMGLGQTTRLTTQYVANKDNGANLMVCEHDKNWIDIYCHELAKSDNIQLNHCELEYFDYEGKQNDKYKNMLQIVGDKKFDLIIVDGPVGGGKNLPRSNIIDLIPNNLAEDFVIIIDDSEREGEQKTIAKIKQKLNECNIKYSVSERRALKGQTIIMSTSREFVKFL